MDLARRECNGCVEWFRGVGRLHTSAMGREARIFARNNLCGDETFLQNDSNPASREASPILAPPRRSGAPAQPHLPGHSLVQLHIELFEILNTLYYVSGL